MGDLAFAGADFAGHGVEAGGQAADLVAGGDVDLGALAALQPAHGLGQGGDRPRDAARQGPAADHQDQEAQKAHPAGGLQQHLVGLQRQRHGVAQHQGGGDAGAQGLQRRHQGDGRAADRRQLAGPVLAARQLEVHEPTQAHRIQPGAISAREAPDPGPLLVDHRRPQRDRRQPLEGAHLVAVQLVGEHHPAGERGRQDRRRNGLERRPGQGEDARSILVLVQRGQHLGGRRLDRLAVGRHRRAVEVHDEGPVGVQPVRQIAQRRADGGCVFRRHRLAESVVAREQARAFLHLL